MSRPLTRSAVTSVEWKDHIFVGVGDLITMQAVYFDGEWGEVAHIVGRLESLPVDSA